MNTQWIDEINDALADESIEVAADIIGDLAPSDVGLAGTELTATVHREAFRQWFEQAGMTADTGDAAQHELDVIAARLEDAARLALTLATRNGAHQ